ncbi:hypothetical protein ACYOEI_23275, partial [Singulisphaera rosea]
TSVYNGLPGEVTAVHQGGPFIFVTTSVAGTERITVLHTGATPADQLTLVGSLNFNFPANWEHTTYATAIRPTPGQSGDFDLFFNIGSQYNGVVIGSDGRVTLDSSGNPTYQPTTGTVSTSGLLTATLNGDSIYKVTVHDNSGTPVLSNLTQIASGLRNAASLVIDPNTGDLWLADNGIDGNEGGNEAWSTDELDKIPAAQIGGAIENFGFPYSYTRTIDKPGDPVTVVNPGPNVVQPIIAYEPLPDSVLTAEGSESEGSSGIALSPALFPAGLNNGVFVGFHGLFVQGGLDNDENPFVYADPATGKYFDFISNNEANIGHLDEALSTADSLFIADISSTGSVFGSDGPGMGVIYQIKVITHTLAITTQPPSSVKTGQTFSLTVTAKDANGDPDPTYHGPITLSLAANPGNGMLSGTLTVNAVNGVATFSGLSLNKPASGYLIKASATGLTTATSTAISVTSASTKLAITTQPPSSVKTGQAFSLTVTAKDANGNLDPNYNGPITLSLAANPGNGMLSGTLTVNAVHGVATFSGLSLNKPASGYLIKASATGLTAATSSAITVTTAATQLAITTQPPPNVKTGETFSLVVTAKDANGNVDPNYSGPVTLSLATNPGNGMLSGTLTVNAVHGVATFSGLSLNRVASGYLIKATSSSLATATSTAIAVSTASTQLAMTTQPPSNVKTGELFTVVVTAKDANGNLDPNYNGPITLSLAANPGNGMLSGTLTVTAVHGVATFTGLWLNKPASGYLIKATSSSLATATSTAIAVTTASTQLA